MTSIINAHPEFRERVGWFLDHADIHHHQIGGEWWVNAASVAELFELDMRDLLKDLEETEKRLVGPRWLITGDEALRWMFYTDHPQARAVTRWITREVLPAAVRQQFGGPAQLLNKLGGDDD